MEKTYKNVIFDFSDTLCRFVAKDYLVQLLNGDQKRAEKIHQQIFLSQQWQLYDRGKVSEEENTRSLLALLDPADRAVAAVYLEHWHEHYIEIPGMKEIILDLKKEGIKVYLLSSYPERFEKCYERLEILQMLDGRLISYEAGIGKDDPEFFKMLLRKYNLTASECIYFDDGLPAVQTGRSVGINAHVFIDAVTTRKLLRVVRIIRTPF